MITVYGIRQCDTVRKSLAWFRQAGVDHRFHDVRQDGLDETVLSGWLSRFGWEVLVNRKGTTWKKLAIDPDIMTGQALRIILENPTLVRRPLVDFGTEITLGYLPDTWNTLKSKPCPPDA
jgi:arsenate reductase